MNTPVFECQQNAKYLIIKIDVPFYMMKKMEYLVTDNHIFRFYCTPYFLRLTFHEDQEIISDKNTDLIKYEEENKQIIISILKKKEGQRFRDLEMITKLLSKPKSYQNVNSNNNKNLKPLIEVISSNMNENLKISKSSFLWEVDQKIVKKKVNMIDEEGENEKNVLSSSNNNRNYGFNREYENIFEANIEFMNMVDLPSSPESYSSKEEIYKIMRDQELKDFDGEHVIHDLMNYGKEIKKRLDHKPFYCLASNNNNNFAWNEMEKFFLKNLPKKEYLIGNMKRVWICLLDILASYCYFNRCFMFKGFFVNENDQPNCKVCWTVQKLCSSLCYLNEYPNLDELCVGFTRRSLVYPLYRNFDLSFQCLLDVLSILKKGKPTMLRILVFLNKLFQKSQEYYVFEKIFLQDYSIWIQSVPDFHFNKVGEKLEMSIRKLKGTKYQSLQSLCLQEIEEFAKEEIREVNETRVSDN